MVSAKKTLNDIKWGSRQRLQFIEMMAYYTGVVTRTDIVNAFGISDAAATKDLNFYSQLAPANLIYKHAVFGFVPGDAFRELFADLSPAVVLPMLAANLPATGSPTGANPIYGISVDSLPLPSRLPSKTVLAQLVRAIRTRRKLTIKYHSLSDRESKSTRIIEPHSLINTGLRWHVRAYSEETYDFRDFVLSRIIDAQLRDDGAESSVLYDDDWMETVTLQLTPHPNLTKAKRESLVIDYGARGEVIELTTRRALVGYVLQRLAVDTSVDHSLNPNAYQLIVMNREEIEPFAGWAFQ